MNFNEYLIEQKLSIARFAKAIEVNPATVTKWKYNGVIPRKADIIKIYDYTDGKVSPNDFYGVNK
jgi:transcriptional regulator with XRE-family HTH domain